MEKFNFRWLRQTLPSCGAFKINKISITEGIVTIDKDPHWSGMPALLDRINFYILDPSSSIQAFTNGTLDAVPIQTSSDLAQLTHLDQYDLRKTLNPKWYYLAFNGGKNRLTSDVNLRKALQLGVDTQFIRTCLLRAFNATIPPLGNHLYLIGQAGYCNNSVSYNLGTAKKYLDDLGWKPNPNNKGIRSRNGQTLTLTLLTRSDNYREKLIAEIVQTQLNQLGIKTILRPVPSTNFFTDYFLPGNFDLAISDWVFTPGPISSNYSIYALYYTKNKHTGALEVNTTRSPQNNTFIGNEHINALFEQGITTTNPQEQQNIANQIDQALWNIANTLPLFQTIETMVCPPKLANFGENVYGSTLWHNVGFLK